MEEAISILKVLKQKELLCIVLSNLAEVQLWRGMWLESTQNAKESLQLSRENFYQVGQGTAPDLFWLNQPLNVDCIAKPLVMPKRLIVSPKLFRVLHLKQKASFILAKIQLGLDNPKAALSLLKPARKILQANDPEQYQLPYI